MSSAESSCTKRSSSTFASSSAMGCSKSRKVVFMRLQSYRRKNPRIAPAGPWFHFRGGPGVLAANSVFSIPADIQTSRIDRRVRRAGLLRLEHDLHVAPLARCALELVSLGLERRAPARWERFGLDLDAVGPPLMVVPRRADHALDVDLRISRVIQDPEQHLA